MKKILLPLAAMFFLISASITNAADETLDNFVPNRIIVKFKSSFSQTLQNQFSSQERFGRLNLSSDLTQLNEQYHVKKISPLIRNIQKIINSNGNKRSLSLASPDSSRENMFYELTRIYTIEMDLQSGQTVRQALEEYRDNPNIEYAEPDYYVTIDSAPNDPMNFSQWSFKKIEAQNAWDIYTGNHKTIVAVIDTGVDYNHRDIHNNIWINKMELTGKASGNE